MFYVHNELLWLSALIKRSDTHFFSGGGAAAAAFVYTKESAASSFFDSFSS